MKVRIQLLVVLLLSVAIIIIALMTRTEVNAYSSGPPAGVTGSPGDGQSCTACHSGAAKAATGFITSNIPPSGYSPDQTYTITANLVSSSVTRFGFEISPQNVLGAKLGTLYITDASRTQLTGFGDYITHTLAGTSGNGSITWSFDWKAPIEGSGSVTFYGAFNFTNHNGSDSGDTIKLCTLTVAENLSASAEQNLDDESVKIWPNPVADDLYVTLPDFSKHSSIKIFDSGGNQVDEINKISVGGTLEIDLSGVEEGIYFISLVNEKGTYLHKFIKL